MPPNGGRGSQVPLGNNYIIRTGAGAGGLLVICEEQGGEPKEGHTHIHTDTHTHTDTGTAIFMGTQR